MNLQSLLNLSDLQTAIVSLGALLLALSVLFTAAARFVDALSIWFPALSKVSSWLHVAGTDSERAGAVLQGAKAARMVRRGAPPRGPSAGRAVVEMLVALVVVGLASAGLGLAEIACKEPVTASELEQIGVDVGVDTCAVASAQPEPGWVYVLCGVVQAVSGGLLGDAGAEPVAGDERRVLVKVPAAQWQAMLAERSNELDARRAKAVRP